MPDARRTIIVPTGQDMKSMSVDQIAAEAGPLLDEILERARDQTRHDSDAAAEMLLLMLGNAVTDFEELCTSNPARFISWAREREDWPVVFHRHPGLNRRTQETIKNIELGTRTELNYLNKSFSHDTPANRVVLDLYYLVKFYQGCGRVPGRLILFDEAASEETRAEINRWCATIALTLPGLSRDTYEEWNDKTRPLLHLHYGENFQDRPQFASLVQGVQQTNKRGEPSPAHRRSRVYDAVKEAWRSISAFPVQGEKDSGK